MSDLDKLRGLSHQVHPPRFDSLVTTADRRRRRLAAAGAAASVAAILLGGGAFIASGADRPDEVVPADHIETTVPTPTPSTPAEATYAPKTGEVVELPDSGTPWAVLRQGRYAVPVVGSTLGYEVEVPDRVRAFQSRFLNTRSADSNSPAGIFFIASAPAEQTHLPANPCLDHTKHTIGPTVSDLAQALRRQPVLNVTRPLPVTVDGHQGLHLEVRIPDKVDTYRTCQNDTVKLFSTPDHSYQWDAGFIGLWWILDVDGKRVVVNAQCDTTCSSDDFDTLTGMAASISITRRQ
jgi:hypothetical protein